MAGNTAKNAEAAHHHDDHAHGSHHGHSHGLVDRSIIRSREGVKATSLAFLVLMLTGIFQLVIFGYGNSLSLLADLIHNMSDALTAIPLAIAFILRSKKGEKWAGYFVVFLIFVSACVVLWQVIERFINPSTPTHLWAILIAGVVGFLGNEAVAVFRIKVGREIGSAALIADGYHARTDGLTSLAVLFGAIGVWLGFPLADPIVGLVITAMILRIVWDSAKSVFTRLLDGVEPEIPDEIAAAAKETPQVEEVTEVRVRWLGHNLHAELNLAVSPKLTVAEAHDVAVAAQQNLLKKINYLSYATIHIDPSDASGEKHHEVHA